ncbi:hypothetical protein GOQ30_15220 [Flavobacterium sp. TP390]|uniref:Uncharacterized protein n=1 Tax=Flavobacterium profundi TaxID=1774945 RepID=A0A6I4IUG8_9FLAO|nr:hypothetical protein [Flavobacterium profundi]MVO10523.1 hypothetical protein [Flavobacterium profundi]
MSTQIKNTLFRFVTMRAPELLEKETIDKSFVKHPELDGINQTFTSAYLSDMQTASQGKRVSLESTTASFETNAVEKKEQLVDNALVSQEMYDFSIWLTKNRNRFTLTEISTKISENEDLLEGLDEATLVLLWDNLFYQIVNSKSNYLRDIILSILVADFFLKNYPTVAVDNLDQLRKFAQARVIMPKELFEKEGASTKDALKKQALSELPLTTKNLDSEITALVSNQKIDLLKKAKEELVLVKKKYQKENQKAYNLAQKTYQEDVKSAYDAADTIQRIYTDPITNEERTITEYVDLVLPTFEFLTEGELNLSTISNSVSQETATLVENIVSIHDFETFDEINDFINSEIISLTDTVFTNSNSNQTLVNTNGVVIPVSTLNTDTPNTFTVKGLGLGYNPTMSLQILFNQIPNVTDVVSASYTVGSSKDINSFSQYSETFSSSIVNGKLAVTVFTEGLSINQLNNFDFFGEIVLTNGTKINFSGVLAISTPILGSIVNYSIKGKGNFELELVDDTIGIGEGNTGNVVDYMPTGFGISRLGVADYRKVEQEVCCYVPGEVSHIENVMAREYKEKTTRRLRRTEDTTTTSKEQEIEKLTDTSTTDRFEMNQEVSSLLAEDKTFGSHGEMHWGGIGDFGGSIGADFATNTTSEESTNQAISHAKEVTERALDRVVKKVKEERVSKIIEEFSEENTHGFDNRKGDNHVSGVYRWIDKVYKNKIVNYGKRLMYEFMIPEPASFHKEAIKDTSNYDTLLTPPKDPRMASDTTKLLLDETFEQTYLIWAKEFNVAVPEKPIQKINISKSVDFTGERAGSSGAKEFSIPSNYAITDNSKINLSWRHCEAYPGIIFSVGNWTSGYSDRHGSVSLSTSSLKGITDTLAVSYTSWDINKVTISVTLECELVTEAKEKWRLEAFNAIIAAYEIKLAEYNEALATLKLEQVEKTKINPGFYRQIENMVFRKNCIEYLISHEALGKGLLLKGNDENPLNGLRVDYNSPALETYAAKVKFFEQAFEWNLMSYFLYPFYWAQKDNWKALYNINEIDDPTFKAFLQSGMARVILTVRPGFEEAVNWYMATGQIWNGGQVPTMDDELYVSIIEELRNPEGEVEETWESRVPTSLTLIQAGSIGLEVTGLPCNTECGDHLLFDSDMNPIVQTNAAIGDTETADEPQPEPAPADA